MQTQLVGHVSDLVFLICLLRDGLERTVLGVVEIDCRPSIADFGQASFEDLHDAVGVGVAVRGVSGGLPWLIAREWLEMTRTWEQLSQSMTITRMPLGFGGVSKGIALTGESPAFQTHRSLDRRP